MSTTKSTPAGRPSACAPRGVVATALPREQRRIECVATRRAQLTPPSRSMSCCASPTPMLISTEN
jgi:hypothetical protein